MRDYLHVVDLALGHVAALKRFDAKAGCEVFNLGTGNGTSVLQVVEVKIPHVLLKLERVTVIPSRCCNLSCNVC